ncbi:hypothetical protein ACLOJK_011862 [Asimina triloba]
MRKRTANGKGNRQRDADQMFEEKNDRNIPAKKMGSEIRKTESNLGCEVQGRGRKREFGVFNICGDDKMGWKKWQGRRTAAAFAVSEKETSQKSKLEKIRETEIKSTEEASKLRVATATPPDFCAPVRVYYC